MTGFTASNGSQLFIGPAIDTDTVDDITDLSNLTGWLEVKGLKDLSNIGDEAATITSNQLNVNRTMKQKGTADAGSPGFVVDVKDGDPGQQALFDAAQPDNQFDYAFYIIINNQKTPGGQKGRRYFAGKAMSWREGIGAANNAITATITVGINTKIYKVSAT